MIITIHNVIEKFLLKHNGGGYKGSGSSHQTTLYFTRGIHSVVKASDHASRNSFCYKR